MARANFRSHTLTLSTLARFIKPGGIIVTEIPNLISMHGFFTWLWQPELYYKHKLIGKGKLSKSHTNIGFIKKDSYYLGIFSMNIVAWELYHRYKFYKYLTPALRKIAGKTNQFMKKHKKSKPGSALFSPFVGFTGMKP